MKEQRFSEWEILEVHTDIYEVSDREQELQLQYGYTVDRVPYWKIQSATQIPNRNSKISSSMKGNTNTKGIKHTEIAKANMSASQKGNTNASGNKGKKLSEETKRKISEAMKQRHAKAKHEKIQRIYTNTTTTESN